MQHYRISFPAFIATRDDLSGDEKIFYGIIESLCCKYGYCWASNKVLAQLAHKSVSQIQRYLRKLVKLGLLFVEIEFQYDRKIWTRETWFNRDMLQKSFDDDLEFNKRFGGYVMDDVPPRSSVLPYIDNDIYINKKGGIGNTYPPAQAKPASRALPPTPKTQKKKTNTSPPPDPLPDKPKPQSKKIQPKNELSKSEKSQVVERFGQKEADKAIANAIAHREKCPNSKYNKIPLYEVVVEFASKNLEEKKVNKNSMIVSNTKKSAEYLKKMLKLNPWLKSIIRITDNLQNSEPYVELYPDHPYSKALRYSSEDFIEQLRDFIHKSGIHLSKEIHIE